MFVKSEPGGSLPASDGRPRPKVARRTEVDGQGRPFRQDGIRGPTSAAIAGRDGGAG